jgi:hypothetical protein
MNPWKEQLDKLNIPYPQKTILCNEIQRHIENFPEQCDQTFTHEAMNDLYEIHNTALFRFLESLHPTFRHVFEFVFAAAPITVLLIYLMEENFMSQFIHEGGPGMYVILAIGILMLAREFRLLQRVFIVKDHSPESLNIDSMTVVIGTLALVLMGVTVRGLGAYHSALFVGNENLPISILIIGLKESITGLVLSSSLAAVILLLHFFTRRMMVKWKIPGRLLG